MELNDNRLTSADLLETVRWTKGEVSKLFDPYAESTFAEGVDPDRQNWDRGYYGMQAVYITANFSEKRLLHLIEVRDFLRSQKVSGFVPLPPKNKR